MSSLARSFRVSVCGLVALCSLFLLPEAQGLNASVRRAAKIVVVPLPLSSHVAIHDAIIVEMLDRGHQVKVCIWIHVHVGRSQMLDDSQLVEQTRASLALMTRVFRKRGHPALLLKIYVQ